MGVAAIARGHHAVKHINATLNPFEDIHRSTYPHQITRAVGGKDFIDHLNHFIHLLRRFSYGQSADGIAFSIFFGHEVRALTTQVGINTALYNGEKRLMIAVLFLCFGKSTDAAFQPAMGQVKTFAGISVIGCTGRTLIKCHHDVGTDAALSVHHVFGRKEVF